MTGGVTPRESPARGWAATRVHLGLLLVLLYAGASTARSLHRAAAWPGRPAQDEISANDRRFEPLRSELPERGLVGYVGDPEPTGPTPHEADAAALLHFRRYLLAQYALAPVILVEGTEPALVVGNFFPEGPASPPDSLRRVADFGDGLVLWRRRAP